VSALRSIFVVLTLVLISLLLALGSSARAQQGSESAKTTSPKFNKSAEGEKRFRANCGRCHHPPEDLSPREARAVLRQMRVRAMLSAEDERLILKFLAP
jgi:cytochrome c553